MKSKVNFFGDFYVDITRNGFEEHLMKSLERNGLITFDGINSRDELLGFSKRLGTIFHHRDSDEDGVTHITNSDEEITKDGYLAFSSSSLTLHTDRSSASEPPTWIVFFCNKQAEEGGDSLFVDVKEIYDILSKQHPTTLQTLKTPNSAIFGADKTQVVGSILNTLQDGQVYVRFRYDSLGYYSAPVVTVLSDFLNVMDKRSMLLSLSDHQGYIVQNGRWLHGRTSFKGKREAYRILVDPASNTSQGRSVYFGFTPLESA